MRYHCGLAAGHVYTCGGQDLPRATQTQSSVNIIEPVDAIELEGEVPTNEDIVGSGWEDVEDVEYGLESRDTGDLLNAEEEEEEEEEEEDSEDDERRVLAMDEMYPN